MRPLRQESTRRQDESRKDPSEGDEHGGENDKHPSDKGGRWVSLPLKLPRGKYKNQPEHQMENREEWNSPASPPTT